MSDCKRCKDEKNISCHDCRRTLTVNLDDIKQNGLELDSPMLWALLPDWVGYIVIDEEGCLELWDNEPTFDGDIWQYNLDTKRAEDTDFLKINYNGDRRESLTKRPEGM